MTREDAILAAAHIARRTESPTVVVKLTSLIFGDVEYGAWLEREWPGVRKTLIETHDTTELLTITRRDNP